MKLRSLLLTALIRVPSTAISSWPNRSRWRQSSTNWRNTGRKAWWLMRRKVGDRFEVGLQVPQQPDDPDVAMALGFQAPARPNAIEVAVDVELQQILGGDSWAAGRLWLHPDEARGGQVQPVDEGVCPGQRIRRAISGSSNVWERS